MKEIVKDELKRVKHMFKDFRTETISKREIYRMINVATSLKDGEQVRININHKFKEEDFSGDYTVKEFNDEIYIIKNDNSVTILLSRLIENILDMSMEIIKIDLDNTPAKKAEVSDMELGNLLFGHSRGEFVFPQNFMKDKSVWEALLKKAGLDFYGSSDDDSEFFENDVFIIRPYYWGNDEKLMDLSNFVYKPEGFEINWYKYPFRDSYMNKNYSVKEVEETFRKCLMSL